MSLVVSILLTFELVLLAIKLIDRRITISENKNSDVSPKIARLYPVEYLRQIAFLFYFTGLLGASFIPLLARNLTGSNATADFIAGLPYSVEAFTNCVAILFTARFVGKKGWKPPYLMGIALGMLPHSLEKLCEMTNAIEIPNTLRQKVLVLPEELEQKIESDVNRLFWRNLINSYVMVSNDTVIMTFSPGPVAIAGRNYFAAGYTIYSYYPIYIWNNGEIKAMDFWSDYLSEQEIASLFGIMSRHW